MHTSRIVGERLLHVRADEILLEPYQTRGSMYAIELKQR